MSVPSYLGSYDLHIDVRVVQWFTLLAAMATVARATHSAATPGNVVKHSLRHHTRHMPANQPPYRPAGLEPFCTNI
jgi:hypothetical protein